jgi:hypothetical protein
MKYTADINYVILILMNDSSIQVSELNYNKFSNPKPLNNIIITSNERSLMLTNMMK